MFDVFVLQWKRLLKQPLLVFMFLGLTILFVYFMGGAQFDSTIYVPTYTEDLSSSEFEGWIERLNEEDESIVFNPTDVETAEKEIRLNDIGFAMEISKDTYRFLAGRENEQIPVVNQHVQQIFRKQERLEAVQEGFPEADVKMRDYIAVNHESMTDLSGAHNAYQLTILSGMTLYFLIYTILFLQINLVEEKRLGTWDRMIFSPLSKTQNYLGHLLFYFTVGAIQMLLSFLVLVNLMGIELGSNYGPMIAVAVSFLFAIVSLGILVAALTPTPQSLQVVIPIVATSMAMLGGSFWPLEIVSNRILLFLAELTPIKHGTEGIMGAATRNLSISELIQPIGILILMGVLFMGIGINLMERVSNE